jgi:long-chain acyl-CoA synthetase
VSVTTDAVLHCGARSITRDELKQRSLTAASGLQAIGVMPGQAVALLLRNDFAFFEASFAATAIGAYALPINWHLAAAEITYVLNDSQAKVLIAHSDLLNAIPDIVASARRAGVTILYVATPAESRAAAGLDETACAVPTGASEWNDWLNGYEPLEALHGQLTETMIYTSGTTGKPKGVRRVPQSREHAAEFAKIRDQIYGIRAGSRAIVPGPLYHSAPNSFGLRASQRSSCLVLMPRFDTEVFLQQVAQHRISNVFMVPTMLVRLLKLPQAVREQYDVTSLEHVTIAAAPCAPDIKRAIIEWWGPVVHEFYGATEMGYMTACTSKESLQRPGTVGRAVSGATIKALDEAGEEVPVGEAGELYGRLSLFPDFTYNNRAQERAAIERDGLITCGDVGYFDDDGYLYLCDRRREMVISGGVNIYPAEIESVLVGMPGILDCAVIGIPDEEFGESLLALVQPVMDADRVPTQPQMIAWLRERLAGFKVPRQIEFRTELPRDDSGKIYKRHLREPYWQDQQRRI